MLTSVLAHWRARRVRQWRRRLRRCAVQVLRVPPLPAGLDVEQFLGLARLSFVHLQAAWDAGDLASIERLTTGPLRGELRELLAARGDGVNRTEVLDLRAALLAFEELREAFVASVEFSGLIREQTDGSAAEFRELWLLTHLKSEDGAGRPVPQAWQLARVQALG